jgi:hypothetical protein
MGSDHGSGPRDVAVRPRENERIAITEALERRGFFASQEVVDDPQAPRIVDDGGHLVVDSTPHEGTRVLLWLSPAGESAHSRK